MSRPRLNRNDWNALRNIIAAEVYALAERKIGTMATVDDLREAVERGMAMILESPKPCLEVTEEVLDLILDAMADMDDGDGIHKATRRDVGLRRLSEKLDVVVGDD